MAERHVHSPDENFVDTNDDTRSVRDLEEDDTTTTESSTFSTANEDYFSTRIQSIMENRNKFKTALEREIEASKEHWSEVPSEVIDGVSEIDSSVASSAAAERRNWEVFRSLQQQYNFGPSNHESFFKDWEDDRMAVGEKLAEGAQGEIYALTCLRPEEAQWQNKIVMKVFKKAWSLEDLQKQWPPGMLLHANADERGCYDPGEAGGILCGTMLNDGRFAFLMLRCWGDLRKLIDLKMEHNGNQAAPPFKYDTAMQIMLEIAVGMRELHKDNIEHRDLKASNVLIFPNVWHGDYKFTFDVGFDPTRCDDFRPIIADYETSLGVWGTRFWRAPEVLLGLKNRDVRPSLFTQESDAYSYAMTCYEILTGKIPMEDVRASDYDAILQGARPKLPSDIEPWIEFLLSRCWNHEPSLRPSFDEIVQEFTSNGYILRGI